MSGIIRHIATVALLVGMLATSTRAAEPRVDFVRDIQPLFAQHCNDCHGAKKKGGLRLDMKSAAMLGGDSADPAIAPGKPDASLVIKLVKGHDGDVMPPKGDPLSKQQVALLERWIAEGANWPDGVDKVEVAPLHWSFVKPTRPELPAVKNDAWVRNGIDRFVLAWLEKEGLRPSPEADRHTLIRRVSLDLIGLPPTPEQVERFVNDKRSDAYERLVDDLLASPRYGERWARVWLDLARYADTQGYEKDNRRTIWRYRDWVIEAFNRDLPYDRFTIEQLAGDMLPDATTEQILATAFHRNTMTNTEGGTDDEEFRVAAVKDRVDTTMQVWMGLTFGCAKCHTHKYDPITQREYYSLYAVFNQTEDADRSNEAPTMPTPTVEQQRKLERIDARVAELKKRLDADTPELRAGLAKWEQQLRDDPSGAGETGRYVRVDLPGKGKILSLAEVQVFSDGRNVAPTGKASQSSVDYDGPPQLANDGNTDGDYNRKSVTHTKTENDPWWEVDLGEAKPIDRIVVWNRTDGGGAIGTRLDGFRVSILDANRKAVWTRDAKKAPAKDMELAIGAAPVDVLAIVNTPADKRSNAQAKKLLEHYRAIATELKPVRDEIASLEHDRRIVKPVTTPIMRELPENKRRTTRVMLKGSFLSPGDEVQPAVPEVFHDMPADAEVNRLTVARWLVSADNPLTARVAVNRYWEKLFGLGLVETSEDFGTQGVEPTHPQLLDWLAVEFMQRGWSMKELLKLIVTSATYRQASHVTPELVKQDPRNELLARGPRFRLEAEMVRDQALAVAGLLSDKMYGESVMPPQPDNVWMVVYSGDNWKTSAGEDRYRRGIYTFWRRTSPYPSMIAFDAVSREVCTIRRIRTNTPLAALVTLNDPVYVEAAQALARRVMTGDADARQRAEAMLRLVLIRPPRSGEVDRLVSLYLAELATYHDDKKAAEQMSGYDGKKDAGVDPTELAAWTVVGNVLLNLDETLTKG